MQERLEHGFNALEDALKRIGLYEPDNRFAPLAETLLWIDLLNTAFYLDDGAVYVEKRQDDAAGVTIEGLRYARHRLTHDVMVYGMHEMQYEGGAFTPGFSNGFDIGSPTWRWRYVKKLPTYDRDKQIEKVYKKHLQGKEVEPTLNDTADFLRRYRTIWTPTPDQEK
jgi:hypothetical protein